MICVIIDYIKVESAEYREVSPPYLPFLSIHPVLALCALQRHYPNCPAYPLGPGLLGRSAALWVRLSHYRCCDTSLENNSAGTITCHTELSL